MLMSRLGTTRHENNSRGPVNHKNEENNRPSVRITGFCNNQVNQPVVGTDASSAKSEYTDKIGTGNDRRDEKCNSDGQGDKLIVWNKISAEHDSDI